MTYRKTSNEIIAGRNPVIAALQSETAIEKIYILRGVQGAQIQKIRTLARQKGIPCIEIDRHKFREIVSDTTTQGVAALVGSKTYVEIQDILNVATSKNESPFIAILDEIEDPHNLGAIIRTAECAGVHGVIISKHHSASITTAVAKSSSGAIEFMPVAKVTNIANTIDELKTLGIWVVGTIAEAEKNYTEIDYESPIAIVIGSEGSGIRRLVKEKCDFLVKIPMFGKTESMNASVAAALVMYEVVRKRKSW
jgi:23S rRNA (guanosine2251-2'-O)-methyltransferase